MYNFFFMYYGVLSVMAYDTHFSLAWLPARCFVCLKSSSLLFLYVSFVIRALHIRTGNRLHLHANTDLW